MTLKQRFTYFILILLIYTVLNIFVYGFLKELFMAFSIPLLIKRIIFILIMLFVNPFLTFMAGEMVPFRISGLKVADGLDAQLHSDIEV